MTAVILPHSLEHYSSAARLRPNEREHPFVTPKPSDYLNMLN